MMVIDLAKFGIRIMAVGRNNPLSALVNIYWRRYLQNASETLQSVTGMGWGLLGLRAVVGVPKDRDNERSV